MYSNYRTTRSAITKKKRCAKIVRTAVAWCCDGLGGVGRSEQDCEKEERVETDAEAIRRGREGEEEE